MDPVEKKATERLTIIAWRRPSREPTRATRHGDQAWHAQHLLLLTATPHMGKDYPYYALWRLLEPEVLTTIEAFDQFPTGYRKQHFIRRTKEELVKLTGEPLYPRRIADTLAYDLAQGNLSAAPPACAGTADRGTAQAGDRRCIEVKGRASTGEIEVTDNEWARACNLRGDYWLYAVYHCAMPTPQMVRVQDPFEKLLVRPFMKTQIVETVRELGGVRIAQAQVLEAGEL